MKKKKKKVGQRVRGVNYEKKIVIKPVELTNSLGISLWNAGLWIFSWGSKSFLSRNMTINFRTMFVSVVIIFKLLPIAHLYRHDTSFFLIYLILILSVQQRDLLHKSLFLELPRVRATAAHDRKQWEPKVSLWMLALPAVSGPRPSLPKSKFQMVRWSPDHT